MRLGIDASNITSGGGLTHLVAFLQDAIEKERYERVVVWSSEETLRQLPRAGGRLEYRSNPSLNGGILKRVLWTTRHLAAECAGDVDVLFVPGGLYLGAFRPFVTMCRNMLPFDRDERARFGFSREGIRLRILRVVQAMTFKRATRLIFLSRYAQQEISSMVSLQPDRQSIVPHGIAEYFRDIRAGYDGVLHEGVPRLVYVSTLMPYKYQLELVDAVAKLHSGGLQVHLTLVGSGPESYVGRVRDRIRALGVEQLVSVAGQVPHHQLPALYRQADGILYASGCENFPNILVEAMATGLPVISSDRGPMPDILGQQAIYFDPGSIEAMSVAIRQFVQASSEQRRAMALDAHQRAAAYGWPVTFDRTEAELRRALP